MSTENSIKSRRRFPRFSLKLLLLLTVVAAGMSWYGRARYNYWQNYISLETLVDQFNHEVAMRSRGTIAPLTVAELKTATVLTELGWDDVDAPAAPNIRPSGPFESGYVRNGSRIHVEMENNLFALNRPVGERKAVGTIKAHLITDGASFEMLVREFKLNRPPAPPQVNGGGYFLDGQNK